MTIYLIVYLNSLNFKFKKIIKGWMNLKFEVFFDILFDKLIDKLFE